MKKATARSLAKTAVLDASDNPEDQDKARERRVKMDFASWRKQTKSGKKTHQEEVGISSSVKMKQAQEKAKRDLIQDKAVAKQKATFRGYSSDDIEKKKVKKEGVQFDEVYKKLPVAKMASKISKKQFKAGQSRDVKTIIKKSSETGKMIGVLDTHDPERSKAKSKIKNEETQIDELNRYEKEKGKSTGPAGTYRGGVNTPRKGTPTKKGGSSEKIIHFAKGLVRKAEGRPTGQTRKSYDDRGKEQDRREKPARTMERIRQMRRDAEKLMRDTSGT